MIVTEEVEGDPVSGADATQERTSQFRVSIEPHDLEAFFLFLDQFFCPQSNSVNHIPNTAFLIY